MKRTDVIPEDLMSYMKGEYYNGLGFPTPEGLNNGLVQICFIYPTVKTLEVVPGAIKVVKDQHVQTFSIQDEQLLGSHIRGDMHDENIIIDTNLRSAYLCVHWSILDKVPDIINYIINTMFIDIRLIIKMHQIPQIYYRFGELVTRDNFLGEYEYKVSLAINEAIDAAFDREKDQERCDLSREQVVTNYVFSYTKADDILLLHYGNWSTDSSRRWCRLTRSMLKIPDNTDYGEFDRFKWPKYWKGRKDYEHLLSWMMGNPVDCEGNIITPV